MDSHDPLALYRTVARLEAELRVVLQNVRERLARSGYTDDVRDELDRALELSAGLSAHVQYLGSGFDEDATRDAARALIDETVHLHAEQDSTANGG